jgi:hypothetical protein
VAYLQQFSGVRLRISQNVAQYRPFFMKISWRNHLATISDPGNVYATGEGRSRAAKSSFALIEQIIIVTFCTIYERNR